jgi:hypothetical protein
MHTIFWFENLKGRDDSKNLRLRWDDENRIDLWDLGCEGVAWMHLPEDKDHWRAVVNTVMNLRVP